MPLSRRLNFVETFVLTGYGRGRSSSRVRRRSGLFAGSTGGKRRPDPHGQRSLRPSFSTSSVSMPTTRSPRLTLDSLEGTPGRRLLVGSKGRLGVTIAVHGRSPCLAASNRIVAGTAVRCQPKFRRPPALGKHQLHAICGRRVRCWIPSSWTVAAQADGLALRWAQPAAAGSRHGKTHLRRRRCR